MYFCGFSWFKWNMKSTKIRAPQLITISQYMIIFGLSEPQNQRNLEPHD